MDNLIVPFKNLLNDAYAKDISKKVRSALLTKRLNGEFIGTTATYCGSSFTLRKVKNYEYYHCISYVRNGSCTSHSIRKDKLTEVVLDELNRKFKRNKIDTLERDILLKNVDSIIVSQDGDVNVKFK